MLRCAFTCTGFHVNFRFHFCESFVSGSRSDPVWQARRSQSWLPKSSPRLRKQWYFAHLKSKSLCYSDLHQKAILEFAQEKFRFVRRAVGSAYRVVTWRFVTGDRGCVPFHLAHLWVWRAMCAAACFELLSGQECWRCLFLHSFKALAFLSPSIMLPSSPLCQDLFS